MSSFAEPIVKDTDLAWLGAIGWAAPRGSEIAANELAMERILKEVP